MKWVNFIKGDLAYEADTGKVFSGLGWVSKYRGIDTIVAHAWQWHEKAGY